MQFWLSFELQFQNGKARFFTLSSSWDLFISETTQRRKTCFTILKFTQFQLKNESFWIKIDMKIRNLLDKNWDRIMSILDQKLGTQTFWGVGEKKFCRIRIGLGDTKKFLAPNDDKGP